MEEFHERVRMEMKTGEDPNPSDLTTGPSWEERDLPDRTTRPVFDGDFSRTSAPRFLEGHLKLQIQIRE